LSPGVPFKLDHSSLTTIVVAMVKGEICYKS
jgi:hypothetical protein